jgi:hypothetical protein
MKGLADTQEESPAGQPLASLVIHEGFTADL